MKIENLSKVTAISYELLSIQSVLSSKGNIYIGNTESPRRVITDTDKNLFAEIREILNRKKLELEKELESL